MSSKIFELFKNIKIRSKLLIVYGTVFILSSLIGGTVIYTLTYNQMKENIEKNLTAFTSNMVDMVKLAANVSIKNHLRTIAEDSLHVVRHIYNEYKQGKITEREAKQRAIRYLLSKKIGKTGYIYCVDSYGVIKVHPNKKLLNVDLKKYKFIQTQIKQKKGYVEYNWKNPGEKKARPKALYMTYFSQWDWIISASSYRDEFTSFVRPEDFAYFFRKKKTYITRSAVLDLKGNFIIKPEILYKKNIYIDRNKIKNMILKFISVKKGKLEYYSPFYKNKVKEIAIFDYIPQFKWVVVSTTRVDQIYSPLKKFKNILILSFLLSFLVLFALTFWVSSTITKPLNSLISVIIKGAKGDLSARIDYVSDDEIGTLSAYFNYFMKKLERYSKNLKDSILERKNIEIEIMKNEQRLSTILSTANEGFWELTNNRVCMDVNPEMCNILGRNQDEIIGHKVIEFTDPKNAEILREQLELRKRGEKSSYEIDFIKADGSSVTCLVNATPVFDYHGKRVGSFAMITDITERKQAEVQIKKMNEELEQRVKERTEELEKSLKVLKETQEQMVQMEKMVSLGQLVAGVAHEINTPVGIAVTASTHMLEKTTMIIDKLKNNQLKKTDLDKFLNTIEESGNMIFTNLRRASELIKSFKQVAVDQSTEGKRLFDLSEYLNEIMVSLKPKLKKTKHEINIKCPSIKLKSYPSVFYQIISNLVMNSIIHGFEDENIEGKIDIEVEKSDNNLRIIYKDNGKGIDESDLNKIFDPFFTTKRGQGGSGLGLHIVYNLVTNKLKGTIKCENRIENGVIFIITFPIEKIKDV